MDYGRPSLALDLLEELRPALVDRFTVRLLNLKVLGAGDFVGDERRGVYLNDEGKKKYFAALEEEMARRWEVGGEQLPMREIFRRQAHALARALENGETYGSFRLPC